MDKLKKSGMEMGDMDIQQMDWVEDNKKVFFIISSIVLIKVFKNLIFQVKAFFIYESSV